MAGFERTGDAQPERGKGNAAVDDGDRHVNLAVDAAIVAGRDAVLYIVI
ncbi:hypothetical protein [Sphingomonas sp. CFBP 8760]|nr:hypothetical protein [Sphingomonas sp. CFBP 8760]MBD8548574.1 hypothetical protein [Sphingomonas sp. CFBP 8760]